MHGPLLPVRVYSLSRRRFVIYDADLRQLVRVVRWKRTAVWLAMKYAWPRRQEVVLADDLFGDP